MPKNELKINEKFDFDKNALDEYIYPRTDYQAEIDSFNLQSPLFNTVPAPPEKTINRILDRLETIYTPTRWTIPDDFASREHVSRICQMLQKEFKEKSSGAIFCREKINNVESVFKKFALEGVVEMVIERINQLQEQDDTRYVSDPVRIFIKKEHHKKKKIAEKRLRLIWGVSLIDQIIDRVLYQNMVDTSIKNFRDVPSKPGMSFKHGGTDNMVRQYSNGSKNWESFDAHSYDFTVSGWKQQIIFDLNARLLNTQGNLREKWLALARKRQQATVYGSFAFSNGEVFNQTVPGRQLSGHLLTIDSNCKGTVMDRVYYDIVQGVPSSAASIIAMGDDSVQDNLPSAQAYCEWVKQHCGVDLTVEGVRGLFEEQNFCSATFTKYKNAWVCVPLNWKKTVASLTQYEKKKEKVQGDALFSACLEYVFHPRFSELYLKLIELYPAKVRSVDYFKSKWLGYEGSSMSISA